LFTVSRNAQWYSNNTLFQADLHQAPDNCHLLYSYGTDLLISAGAMPAGDTKEKNTADGLRYLKKAAAIYPPFALAYSELGNTYLQLQQPDSARRYCLLALSYNPRDMVAGENLAAVYFRTGKYADALQLCRRMVAADTTYARGYRNMGNCYMKLNQFDSAIIAYKASIIFEPAVNLPYERIAIAYKLLGNTDSAQYYLRIAQYNDPGFSY
jgi:tetratricopeptide (TPR) repeat protein